MKIGVITIANNEEKIIPYFISHYAEIADIIYLIDNNSTDDTVKVAKEAVAYLKGAGAIFEFRNFGVNDPEFDDIKQIKRKKDIAMSLKGDLDLLIVVDTDEFIHHFNIPTRFYLEAQFEKGINFFKPVGYQMISESFPDYDFGRYLVEEVTEGVRDKGFDKPVIFNPHFNWVPSVGAHSAQLFDKTGVPVPAHTDSNLLLLHYKMLGLNYRLERIKNTASKLSPIGKDLVSRGVGVQLLASEENLEKEFNLLFEQKESVL